MLGHSSTRALTTASKGESYKRLITTKAIDQAFNWMMRMRIMMMRMMGMKLKAVMGISMMITMMITVMILNIVHHCYHHAYTQFSEQ